jgi:hypothetical protein
VERDEASMSDDFLNKDKVTILEGTLSAISG